MRLRTAALVLLVTLAPVALAQDAPPGAAEQTVSLVGTNDLHGRLASLPAFAGYLTNLRRTRARDHGGVVLVDGGDMFQGTLESNLNEGAAVIRAYNTLGYDAAAIGNHEFDFGPAGPAATPQTPTDDPRGALRARAAEAHFPLLSANLVDEAGHAPPAGWRNVRASTIVRRGRARIGIIGIATRETPHTTIAANFRGLAIRPLAEAITREAQALRAQGATIVVVTAHAGGRCRDLQHADDTSSCDPDQEIMDVAQALPDGLVDAIVAGHTHAGMAQVVHGVAIIESFANGTAFGRVDFRVDPRTGRMLSRTVLPTTELCGVEHHPACDATEYEGAPVVPDARLRASLDAAFRQGDALRHQSLGVTLAAAFDKSSEHESPLGNLLATLMLRARPDAQVALLNGGGIRRELPAGALEYGSLYETFPFDNRFALVRLTGAELRRVLADNVRSDGSQLSVAGVTVIARCDGTHLAVDVLDPRGHPLADDAAVTVVTSDFVATGGDRVLTQILGDAPGPERLSIPGDGPNARDGIADALRAIGGTLRPDDPRFFDRAHPRWELPSARPVRCTARAAAPPAATTPPAARPAHR